MSVINVGCVDSIMAMSIGNGIGEPGSSSVVFTSLLPELYVKYKSRLIAL